MTGKKIEEYSEILEEEKPKFVFTECYQQQIINPYVKRQGSPLCQALPGTGPVDKFYEKDDILSCYSVNS
jgi:hypothetical protein